MNFIHKPLMSGIAICLTFFAYSCATPEKTENKTDFTAYVDPYIGSGEHGHVFVGANVPFGAVQVGPQNIFKGWDWCSGYHYSDSIIIGFSHTHLSGTGCSDLGDILLMPYTGEVRTARGEQDNIEGAASSYYKHANEAVAPGYYSLLMDNGVKAELTATERVALHRYTYPSGSEHRLLINLKEGIGDKAYDTYLKKIDEYTIEGYRFSKGWSPRHKVFFTLKCDQPIESLAVFNDDEAAGNDELTGESVKGVITFKGDAPTALVKVAISSVSCENALANLRTELSHWDIDEVRNEAIDKWNDQLSCISIDTKDERAKKIFYTAMYHAFIAPTLYCDANGDFRGHDDKVYTNNTWKNYSTFSLWDTYRTLHPLFTIIKPQYVSDLVNSMLSIYDQQEKLPIWPLIGGETDQMPGYSAVPIIADAYLKGFTGFDADRAYRYMVASSVYEKQNGVPYVLEKGYIPCDKVREATSIAMEYAADDWGIALMAKKMGKTRVIAETGAGQHGVATATAAALMGMECEVFMGKEDTERQALNVYKMRLLGAKVHAVTSGTATLKDAVSETMREWTNRIADTHYVLGSVMGPHPFPTIVRDFQAVISREIKEQMLEKEGRLPDVVLACVGGGSNAIGTFYNFIEDKDVRLIGCEAAGRGVNTAETAATIATGRLGIFHGMKSYFCQDEYGQIAPVYSISAGLDYPGVGPEHAHLYDIGRAEYVPVTDDEAVDAFEYLSRTEGIIPAIESAHAVAYAKKIAPTLGKDKIMVVTVSGRGDKDCAAIARYRGEDIHE